MSAIVSAEQCFGRNVLKTPAARAFFRRWRRNAKVMTKPWASIRSASYEDAGKERSGAALISALRDHLTTLQQGRCCYCRRPLQGIGWAKPLDHVLAQEPYRQHTFCYRNLAVACFDCNLAKSNSPWSKWPKDRRAYIAVNQCKAFFHPRLHSYDQHVRYIHIDTNGATISVYAGLTPQGRHLCANLLHKTAGAILATSANIRFASAMDKLRIQIGHLNPVKDGTRLLDF